MKNMVLLSGPNLNGNELKYISECIASGWVSSAGPYVDLFEKRTAAFTGVNHSVATSSGTAALHTCLLALGVAQNDLVIAPNITFVATINSIKYTGAAPVLIDADESTWQMDLDLLEEFLLEETEIRDNICWHKKSGRRIPVIIPVHVLGNVGNMDKLMALARKYCMAVVEDSSEAVGSSYNGKHAGTFGRLGVFSYNGNKIITTGGGGMMVTDDERMALKARHLTTQAKASAGEYFHDEMGYNYRMINIAAALGVAQLEQLPGFLKRKEEITAIYQSEFENVGDITFQKVVEGAKPNHWMPTIRTKKQGQILKALNARNLQSRPLWVPMNQLPMFANEIYINHSNVSDRLYRECVSIPCSTDIRDEVLEQVVHLVKGHF